MSKENEVIRFGGGDWILVEDFEEVTAERDALKAELIAALRRQDGTGCDCGKPVSICRPCNRGRLKRIAELEAGQ